jgi:hypothetical protein
VLTTRRHLVNKGHYDEALSILQRMHANSHDPIFYRAEFHQIKSQLQLEKDEQLGLRAIIRRPSYRKRLLLVLGFMLGQQCTAIIPLQNYQVILYESLGITNKTILILVGAWGTLTVISTGIGSTTFDRLGRRRPFYFAMSIITIASILLTAFWATYAKTGNTDTVYGHLTIFAMFLFLFGYAFIMNSFAYAYIPEILPTNIRAVGTAAGFAAQNAVIILLVQVTPLAIEAIAWKYFMIFIFTDVIFMVVFYFQ